VDPIHADYEGASIVGVVAALQGRTRVPWMPEEVLGAKSVVLLVLDGLGWGALEAHRDELPLISSLSGRSITTVVPSTTAAALTSITTGLPPSQHGIVGYRMRTDEGILNVLQWRTQRGEAVPEPVDVQPHRPFGGRAVPVVTRGEFRSGGFTAAHMRGAEVFGWKTPSTLIEHCRVLIDRGEPLVYAYYDGVDQVAHAHGLHDRYFAAELSATDRIATELLHYLPESCALVVTSDHGQVHFGHEGWRRLDAVEHLVARYAGDGRFRSLYAKRGAAEELLAAAREAYDDVAWVMGRKELFDDGWLGPVAPSRSVRHRLGDVVLAAREPVAFTDPTHTYETGMQAGHGSMTPDEMCVPLLAGRGRGHG
jgi:arylsulfatase A-like enzyme